MIEKWWRSVDGGGQAGALLIDLSKAFDCIDHELLIAKLHAYGFDKNSLYFINSYLKKRKHKTKKKSSHSAFAEILFGVPQGSIWDHFFLEFTSVTSFLKIVTLMLLIMLMTIHSLPVYQTLILSFLNFRKTPKELSDCFVTIT